jgi:hypothetical protein
MFLRKASPATVPGHPTYNRAGANDLITSMALVGLKFGRPRRRC